MRRWRTVMRTDVCKCCTINPWPTGSGRHTPFCKGLRDNMVQTNSSSLRSMPCSSNYSIVLQVNPALSFQVFVLGQQTGFILFLSVESSERVELNCQLVSLHAVTPAMSHAAKLQFLRDFRPALLRWD